MLQNCPRKTSHRQKRGYACGLKTQILELGNVFPGDDQKAAEKQRKLKQDCVSAAWFSIFSPWISAGIWVKRQVHILTLNFPLSPK